MKRTIRHGCLLLFLIRIVNAFSTSGNSDEIRPKSAAESPLSAPLLSAPVDLQSTTKRRRDTNDVFYAESTRRRRRRKAASSKREAQERPPAAPLVDSALLRFLSNQKKQQAASQQFSSMTAAESAAESETSRIADDEYRGTSATSSVLPERSRSSISRTYAPAESWMGQYNSNRVTQTLIELGGVEVEAAQKAGEAVQSHVLAKTARRRVRAFLRQRDLLWVQQQQRGDTTYTDTQSASTEVTATADTSALALRPMDYGLKDVIQLLTSLGLTGTDICAILTHTPSVALMRPIPTDTTGSGKQDASSSGETLQVTAKRAFEGLLCSSLKLRRYDARKILRNCPGLLTVRGSKNAEQVVSLLCGMGVSKGSLARDKNALPVLLSRSPAALFRLVAFLSSDAVRMPVTKIGPLLRRSECANVLNGVAPVPRLQLEEDMATQRGLQEDVEPELPSISVSTLWGRSGQERREQINHAYRRMSSTAWTLRHKIGTEDLGKVIAAYPSVLLLDAETQILPVAEYLMHDLGIWQDDLPRVLQLYPALLGMDVADMQRVESYLLSLDVAKENLGSIFRAFPSLLTLDVEKDMKPVVKFLRSIGIANIGRFITRLPPVLGYSVENELVPKWEYLSKVCLHEGSFQLSTFPAYFSYPLDRVIKARYEYLQNVKRIPSQLMALDVILRYGDRDFAIKVAKDQDDGEAFAKFVKSRQKTMNRRKKRANKKVSASHPPKGGANKQ